VPIQIDNPYLSNVHTWLRGNLHTHTINSDGEGSPHTVIEKYISLSYDFIAITDHDYFTHPKELPNSSLTLLPRVEVTERGPHLLAIGNENQPLPDTDRQKTVNAILASQGLAIFCHPNWEEHFNHCPQAILEQTRNYSGIEIVNGVCCVLPGSGYALDRWDRLLGRGIKVWGFANDDTHKLSLAGKAWNMVQSDTACTQDIISALRAGRFYASTGVWIQSIEVSGLEITIRTENADRIVAYGDYQRQLAEIEAAEMTFLIAENCDYTYVRFECLGCGGKCAWTQPFFVNYVA